MTRDEFTALPPAIALGLVYDMARAKLEPMESPRLPLPPKFDSKLGRKGGYCWMSEMLLEDLRYWHDRNAKSTGEHAEKNHKTAKALSFWIKWRECYPDRVWQGERDREQCKAEAPSKNPDLYEWKRRNGDPTEEAGNAPTAPSGFGSFADDADEFGDIPF